jgi:carboxyl-terminal processing protease
MRRFLLCTLALVLAFPAAGVAALNTDLRDYATDELQRAVKLLQERQTEEAVLVMETLTDMPGLDGEEDIWVSLQYNLACGHSLLGDTDAAIACLRQATDAGWANARHMRADTDLDNIRDDPRYTEILAKLDAIQRFWDNEFLSSPYAEDISADEKVAGLSKLWSEVKYNFAFFDQVPDLNWDSLYVAFLPRVRETQSTLQYYRLLEEMCAYLHDGHTGVTPPRELWDSLWADMPIVTDLVEDKVLVIRVVADSLRDLGITEGLEVIKINGIPVKEYADTRVRPYQPASTPQALNLRVYRHFLLSGAAGDSLELTFADRSGKTFSRYLHRGEVRWPSRPQLEFKKLDGSVAYLALNTFSNNEMVAQFDSLFPAISECKALVIDVRHNTGGNSGVGWSILRYLADDEFATSEWSTRDYRPAYRAWGRGRIWHTERGPVYTPHESKHYSGPVVVLTSPETGSAAEDFCVAFDVMKRGVIVGQPTNGSTGQPLQIRLPGGGSARICTKHDTYPDGTEFVGVGVLPDIRIEPTIDDIRKDRDPVLKRALEYLKDNGKS